MEESRGKVQRFFKDDLLGSPMKLLHSRGLVLEHSSMSSPSAIDKRRLAVLSPSLGWFREVDLWVSSLSFFFCYSRSFFSCKINFFFFFLTYWLNSVNSEHRVSGIAGSRNLSFVWLNCSLVPLLSSFAFLLGSKDAP